MLAIARPLGVLRGLLLAAARLLVAPTGHFLAIARRRLLALGSRTVFRRLLLAIARLLALGLLAIRGGLRRLRVVRRGQRALLRIRVVL